MMTSKPLSPSETGPLRSPSPSAVSSSLISPLARLCSCRLHIPPRHQWIIPFVLVLLFFLWSSWLNSALQVMTQRRDDIQSDALHDPWAYYREHHEDNEKVHRKKKHVVLEVEPAEQPDLFYELLPFIKYWIINDIGAGIFGILLLTKFIFFTDCSRVMLAKRFCLIQGILFALRGICIYLTGMTLPVTVC